LGGKKESCKYIGGKALREGVSARKSGNDLLPDIKAKKAIKEKGKAGKGSLKGGNSPVISHLVQDWRRWQLAIRRWLSQKRRKRQNS